MRDSKEAAGNDADPAAAKGLVLLRWNNRICT